MAGDEERGIDEQLKSMKWILAVGLVAWWANANAQDDQREKVRQAQEQRALEQQRTNQFWLDSAARIMERGDYALADKEFRNMLASFKSVPSELAFYFGKNSYYMGQYKQSIDWLSKYIQLKGASGAFSAEAAEILKKSEAELVNARKEQTRNAVEVFSRDFFIDCGPTGKVICPVCAGTTVIIRKGYLGQNSYKTCGYCHQRGTLTCDEYNKLIRGQLQPEKTP